MTGPSVAGDGRLGFAHTTVFLVHFCTIGNTFLIFGDLCGPIPPLCGTKTSVEGNLQVEMEWKRGSAGSEADRTPRAGQRSAPVRPAAA